MQLIGEGASGKVFLASSKGEEEAAPEVFLSEEEEEKHGGQEVLGKSLKTI